jgi:hypothetical protein
MAWSKALLKDFGAFVVATLGVREAWTYLKPLLFT